MSLQAIIFDMDGVLLDSEPVHSEAIRDLMAARDLPYTHLDEGDFYGCTDREVFARLRERYRLAPPVEALSQEWIDRVVALLPARITPMAGVPDVPRRLRSQSLRVSLASSSAPAIIRTTLEGLGLDGLFETVVSGHDVARGKPAPDIFVEAARRMGVEPASCLVVEDSFNGLRAACAAGMRCAVIPCSSTAHQDFSGAAVRLASLLELPAWIEANA